MEDEPETMVGPAANETEIVAPVDYPETPQAWSAPDDQWMRPTAGMRDVRVYPRRLLTSAKYLLPAALVALVLVSVMGGHRESQPAPTPAPAPAVTTWTPTEAADNAYLKALANAGWDTSHANLLLADAHWTCTYLSQGHKTSEAVDYWDQQPVINGDNPVQARDDDAQWVGIMVSADCPQFG